MFRKVHIRLTLLFTAVCTLVIVIMSGLYLYLSRQNIRENSFMSFRTDMASFSASLSDRHVITQSWLSSVRSNYNYNFFIYDNEKPIQFTAKTSTEENDRLIADIREHFDDEIRQLRYTGSVSHKEMTYNRNGREYYVGIICISGEKGFTEFYAADSLDAENEQFRSLLRNFIIIILLTTAALFLFAFLFTRRLLLPIKKNHEQQAHFIAAASHEIRNPVNTIISALDAMDSSEGAQQKEFADIARKEGKRLTLLTEDLLTLARSDNGSFAPRTAPTELDTLVLDCYEAFIAPAKEKNITMNISLPDENVPKADVDSERIKQVVSVILSNAVSYTPDGGKIDIAYTADRSWHRIRVSDSGGGISDDDKEHIFERFYRADRSREDRSHFGLGLAIAKEITDLHHGTLTAEDSPLGGASFVISLPVM